MDRTLCHRGFADVGNGIVQGHEKALLPHVCSQSVFHNGLATAQRPNGGAETDSVVLDGVEDTLYAKMYEAFFCCTMRLAEGLWYVHKNRDLLYAETTGAVVKHGRTYMDGDLLYAEVSGGAEAYEEKTVHIDGHILSPLVKYYRLTDEIVRESKQKILF